MAHPRPASFRAQLDIKSEMKFQMKYDKRSRYVTVSFLLVVAILLGFAFYTSGGSYFPAWLTTLALSIMVLGMLSIPKKLVLTPFSLEVHCLMEITRIAYGDIVRVKLLEKGQMRWCVPFFGVYGVFGYYGYYLDLRRFRTVKVYGRRWSNFVMIEDRFHNLYVLAVEDCDELVKRLDKIEK